jgi:hypothetical protein
VSATILSFPPHRHKHVDLLAKRLLAFPPDRARQVLRAEAERIADTRICNGLPPFIANSQSRDLERAVLRRLEVLTDYGVTG